MLTPSIVYYGEKIHTLAQCHSHSSLRCSLTDLMHTHSFNGYLYRKFITPIVLSLLIKLIKSVHILIAKFYGNDFRKMRLHLRSDFIPAIVQLLFRLGRNSLFSITIQFFKLVFSPQNFQPFLWLFDKKSLFLCSFTIIQKNNDHKTKSNTKQTNFKM